MRLCHILILLAFVAAESACNAGQDKGPTADRPAKDPKAAIAIGETVTELSKAIFYVLQDKNSHYWFGSDGQGVYRYDGKTITRFTTRDGLCSDQIRGVQEDKAGNIYFTTYKGISKFDGQSFTTLSVSKDSATTDWKKQKDDLWFVGAQDDGVVYRYDGKALHRLKFPNTKLGDEHFEKMPRSNFPNAIYSPYDVYYILKDRKGDLWFSTSSVGVCRYDGNAFDWLTDKGLTGAPVRCILEDKKGNFWITSSGPGRPDGSRAIPGIGKLQKGTEGTLLECMSIAEDNDGKIWTASFGGVATKYDGKEQVQYPIKDGERTITLFSITKDKQGVLWLGTHNGGAYRFNGKTFEKFKP